MSDDSADCETSLKVLKAALDSPAASENDKTSSKESVESEDNLPSELTEEDESEDSWQKLVIEQLSKLINKMFRSKMAEKLLKEKMEKQTRPENYANAKAACVNAGIFWSHLRERTKKRDLHLFKMQQASVKGIIPVARIADRMMSAKSLDSERIMFTVGSVDVTSTEYRPSIGQYFVDAPRPNIGHMSAVYQSTVGDMSVNCRWHIGQLSVAYQSYVICIGQLLADTSVKYRSSIGQLSAKCRPSVGQVSARYRWPESYIGRHTYRLTIDWLSTDYPPSVDRVSIDSRPSVDRHSIECRPLRRPI